MNAYTNSLAINRIRFTVHLGYEKEERKIAQPVEIDIKLFFPELTSASLSDGGDYACYDKLSNVVKNMCDAKEFRLIEYLGKEIYDAIRPTLAHEIKILVKITKCNLPVGFVIGGASFSYTDLPPGSWIVPQ